MKSVIKEFLKIFANCMLGLCFMIASFLLLINLYHTKEVDYKFYVRLSEDKRYTSIKSDITLLKDKLNNIDTSVNEASVVKQVLNSCINSLQASKFYQMDSLNYFKDKDIYDITIDALNDINTSCMFPLTYTIENELLNNTPYVNSYSLVGEGIEKNRVLINSEADYLKNRLLANSSYKFTTDTTRISIFNETEDNLFLSIGLYRQVVNSLDSAVTWYADTFGGNNV